MTRWTCASCGEEHSNLPLCFGAEAPWRSLVPDDEFASRVELNDDLCVVDGNTFFIRGHIELPIVGAEGTFAWSVWCSLSRTSYKHVVRRWRQEERVGDGYFGWLSTALPTYPSTLNLRTDVFSRGVGQVPLIRVHECDHPLYLEQANGVAWSRIQQIAHELLHSG